MNTSVAERTYFTSLTDSVRWALTSVGIRIGAIAATTLLVGYVTGRLGNLTLVTTGVCVLAIAGLLVFLGLLLFCFGWMGRVTVSSTGIKAPLYSGRRVFLPWQEIRGVDKRSLNGWPCTTIAGGEPLQELYLMPLGGAKREMVRRISEYAGPTSALVEYFSAPGT